MRIFTAVFATLFLFGCASAGRLERPLDELPPSELEARLQGDLRAVLIYRAGLDRTVAFVRSRPDLFPQTTQGTSRAYSADEREQIRQTWRVFLDYQMALDSVGRYHRDFNDLSGTARNDSFVITYAAFLAQYRFGLEFLEATRFQPAVAVILNEPVPELGLEGDSYAQFRYRYLHLGRATEFAALSGIYEVLPGRRLSGEYMQAIPTDQEYLWSAGIWTGPTMTLANGMRILGNLGRSVWMPVQAGVAEWMGDTRVVSLERALISPAQIEQLRTQLEPGDILLERREWYLSNIGLPGFWSHAALYIGSPEKRSEFFRDAEMQAWLAARGANEFEQLIRRSHSQAYENSQQLDHGHRPEVIEAMSEGVSFTSLEHSAAADSIAVLRPRLPRTAKAEAILRAFAFAGRPYDFDFDFRTDRELVCTELVFRAYEPARGTNGLRLPLVTMLGRPTLPANEFARLFDGEYGAAAQQFELIVFLDGIEGQGRAIEADVGTFRTSWRRPKWHVIVQGEPEEGPPPTAGSG